MGEYASVTSVRLYLGGCLELSCAFRTVSLTKKKKYANAALFVPRLLFSFFSLYTFIRGDRSTGANEVERRKRPAKGRGTARICSSASVYLQHCFLF